MIRGYKCKRCDHITDKPKQKTINKKKMQLCPACEWPGTLQEWEMPRKERPGCCFNCGHDSFTLAIVKRHLLRCCKKCKSVYDTDDNKVIREGEKNE